jgi:GAF domain-containing protein
VMSFPIRADEQRRVETLHALNVVDTLGHAAVTRFVEIGKALFDTPMGAATMIDSDKQWFYARSGLSIHETTRDVAFCNYPIYYGQLFEVTDASHDERFRDNPLVSGSFHLRYYCGAPILLDGTPLGGLCMLDVRPHEPASDSQKRILTELAAAVAREITVSIQLRRAVAELTALMSEGVFKGTP